MPNTKYLLWGDLPDFTEMEANYSAYSTFGFDGVILAPTYSGNPFYTQMWGTTVLPWGSAVPLWSPGNPPITAPSHNFLRANVTPGFDWFDDLSNVTVNFLALINLARASFCRGIAFDNEPYAYDLFKYSSQTNAGSHTFADYKTQVKAYATALGTAMWTAWPSCQFFITGNYWLDVADTGHAPEDRQYGLFSSFLDGLLDSMADFPCVGLILGNEFTYACKDPDTSCFAYGVRNSTTNTDFAGITGNSPEFFTHTSIAMANWLTREPPSPFNNVNTAVNYFTPLDEQNTLILAANYTDRYVWVYTGDYGWVKGVPNILSSDYANVVNNAKLVVP